VKRFLFANAARHIRNQRRYTAARTTDSKGAFGQEKSVAHLAIIINFGVQFKAN